MDFLKSAVASAIAKGPLAPYSVGDRIDVDNSIWSLNNATKREGGTRCSVFTFDIATNRSRLPIARNAVRKSRTLHHPGVVKVLDTIDTDTHIHIITERITPISWYTRRKSLAEETIKWGIYNVAKTVKFINEEAVSVHGCLRTSSIFAGESGEWKVGGFELLSSMKEEDAVIYTYSSLVPDMARLLPPEVASGSWDAIKRQPLPAIDSYGYGLLVYEVFNGSLATPEQAAQGRGIPRSLQPAFKRLLNPSPKARLSTAHFLDQGRRNGGFFQTQLINLSEGIEGLGLMSEGERDEFFSQLEQVSESFPEDFTKRKILPELIKSVEFGGGGPKVFSVVLQIGIKLSEDEYDGQLTPVLVRLFASPDRAMRVCLLENLPLMIDRLSSKIVNDKIFPNLITGFTDQAPLLREQTVKSVLTLITKLSERAVNGDLLKYLAKTANDAEPGIRTNTTICLGKIAKHLNKSSRSKVLIAAFSRSMRDPFVHARNAALLALAATSDVFSEDDCASKILPALCPVLLDKEKPVRDQANKVLDQYLARARKYAQTLPDTAMPPSGTAVNGAAVGGAAAPRMSTPGSDSSWAGWAISSFTNKLTAADGQIQPRANGAALPSSQTQMRAPSSTPISAPTSRPSSSMSVPTTKSAAAQVSRHAPESTKLAASFTAPEVADNDDFWGDDFDDSRAADESKEVDDAWAAINDDWDDSNRTPTPAQQPSSASRSVSTKPAKTMYDDNGEPDFAGWLKAQQSAKKGPGKPLPKGLSKPSHAPSPSAGASSRPGAAPRAATTGSAAVGAKGPSGKGERKKVEETAEEEEEGWGDAWE